MKETQQKKQWQKPDVVLISSINGGGPNNSMYEVTVHSGHYYVNTGSHTTEVSKAVFDGAVS